MVSTVQQASPGGADDASTAVEAQVAERAKESIRRIESLLEGTPWELIEDRGPAYPTYQGYYVYEFRAGGMRYNYAVSDEEKQQNTNWVEHMVERVLSHDV